jgi:nucleoside-diphosphate-sugar epimerase
MRVFVTGATGYIGSAIVCELLEAGHQVVGLARSDTAAAALTAAGAEVQRGNLDDLDSLRAGATSADGVIHTAFNNISETTDMATSARVDLTAVAAIGAAIEGSDKPFAVTSGTLALMAGRLATEADAADPRSAGGPRVPTEEAVIAMGERGVRSSAVRLAPTVHGEGDRKGFISTLIRIARTTGVSAYVGDGSNRWPAVHRLDAARLFRLAVEAPAGHQRPRRGSSQPLRFSRPSGVDRQPDVERTDTGTPGMAAGAARTHPRHRKGSLLHGLTAARETVRNTVVTILTHVH